MKRLLIIMLLLVAFGIASAATIHIKSDMNFDKPDIKMWKIGPYNQYYPLTQSQFGYNEATREITNLGAGTYHLKINGLSGVFFYSVCIERWNLYLLENSYVTIEQYFDMAKHDPGNHMVQ